MSYSLNAQKLMLEFQQDELNSSLIYSHFAKMVKDEKNKKVLLQIAQDEAHHAAI